MADVVLLRGAMPEGGDGTLSLLHSCVGAPAVGACGCEGLAVPELKAWVNKLDCPCLTAPAQHTLRLYTAVVQGGMRVYCLYLGCTQGIY